jgi:hypothetical protein
MKNVFIACASIAFLAIACNQIARVVFDAYATMQGVL